jgi:hypothetical protein
MRRANAVSVAVGLVLAAAGLGALGGLRAVDVDQARATEDWMEQQRERLEPPGAGTMHPVSESHTGG